MAGERKRTPQPLVAYRRAGEAGLHGVGQKPAGNQKAVAVVVQQLVRRTAEPSTEEERSQEEAPGPGCFLCSDAVSQKYRKSRGSPTERAAYVRSLATTRPRGSDPARR